MIWPEMEVKTTVDLAIKRMGFKPFSDRQVRILSTEQYEYMNCKYSRIIESRRWIFGILAFPKCDILLSKMDIIAKDKRYLKPITLEQFQDTNDLLCIHTNSVH